MILRFLLGCVVFSVRTFVLGAVDVCCDLNGVSFQSSTTLAALTAMSGTHRCIEIYASKRLWAVLDLYMVF